MRPPLHVIDTPAPGRLATMAHPRGGGWLADDMVALAGVGVSVLVSALTEDEYARLALAGVAEAARGAGLTYLEFPIVDRGVPQPGPEVGRLADRLAADLLAGRSGVIHCWAAIGRSSLLAAATLVRLGVAPADAWRRISRARGLVVPGTAEQLAWLDAFAARSGGPGSRPG
ncbi:MAG TPA: tyrosine protein phosphatase [Pilimelia sp.]|nr:tyrosine protein phosphatase [Pilimelia sp.]